MSDNVIDHGNKKEKAMVPCIFAGIKQSIQYVEIAKYYTIFKKCI